MRNLSLIVLFGVLPITSVCLMPILSSAEQVDTKYSDAALENAIKAELRRHPRFRDKPLEIRVEEGVVHLEGELASHYDRSESARICRRVSGVQRVANRIVVAPEVTDDASLKLNVEKRLASDASIELTEVVLVVRAGIVTMQGKVPTVGGRLHAANVVRQVRGVRDVRNELAIDGFSSDQPTQNDESIGAAIKEMLGSEPVLADLNLETQVHEGVVKLSGRVGDAKLRVLLREVVGMIQGVRWVDLRQLAVDPAADKLPPCSNVRLLEFALEVGLQDSQGSVAVRRVDDQLLLEGVVRALHSKTQIERAAAALCNGYSIKNLIEVQAVEMPADTIRRQLTEIFAEDSILATASVDIAVEAGTAILTGDVVDFTTKARAGRLASRHPALTAVQNRVRVAWAEYCSDDGIRRAVEKRLRQFGINEDVVVQVEEGHATLSGMLDSQQAVDKAIEIAAATDTVRSAVNHIEVKQD